MYISTINWMSVERPWGEVLPFTSNTNTNADNKFSSSNRDKLSSTWHESGQVKVVTPSYQKLILKSGDETNTWTSGTDKPRPGCVMKIFLHNNENGRATNFIMDVIIIDENTYDANCIFTYAPFIQSGTTRRLLQANTAFTYTSFTADTPIDETVTPPNNVPGETCYAGPDCFCRLCDPVSTDKCLNGVNGMQIIPWPASACNICV